MQHFESKQVILLIFFKVCIYADTIVSLGNTHIFHLKVFLIHGTHLSTKPNKQGKREDI